MIENFRTKKGWNYPSCGYEKCRKGATCKLGKWVCEACNRTVDYPVFRYKLEVVVADETAYTVVVMFNDTATELLKCSAESLIGTKDENSDAEDELNLPVAIRNLIETDHKTIPNSSAEDGASSNTATVTANDVESPMKIYLKSSDPTLTYTKSIIKTKAARYEIIGVEDIVPTLWSTHKFGSQNNRLSRLNLYSTQKILGVRSVKVEKLHGYGYLEEIVVKRVDRQLYAFKEGDFVNLHLKEIEDMLLFAIQHKFFNLNDSDIFDFTVALRMFTRSLIVKRRVKDLQLGVESYQKKLNITTPQRTFDEIDFKEIYTPSHKPSGAVYEDQNQQKRVMRVDELYKFSDCTLYKVQDELHHRVRGFQLGYNTEMPRRKWAKIDRKRSVLMVELIDKQLRER
ncbi:reverse transcriptase domain-containing protein [Tanacetum coccineum]